MTDGDAWHLLVMRVCRRWRSIVSRSQHRLNLQFVYTPEAPARDSLCLCPSLPLVVGTMSLKNHVQG
jgi:hypothetical protein